MCGKIEKNISNVGISPTSIALPDTDDLTSWACVACDQFTSEPEYWHQLEKATAGKKTALDLVLPEIYLDDDSDERIKKINENISKYVKNGYFKFLPEGYILTVRSTPYVKKRIGLIGALDLERYEYSPKSTSLIRATEGTISERIPPRLKIRENAAMEFPHVMVLFDDEKKEITESLYSRRDELEKLYDFELNMGGGRLQGYFVKDCAKINEQFSHLLTDERLISKYGKNDKFLFAVGDGNHSLATAKAHWENLKKTLTDKERKTHPARYALCEFVNVYDEGIYFEPIHRVVSGVNPQEFYSGLNEFDAGNIRAYFGGETHAFFGRATIPEGILQVDAYIRQYINKYGGTVDYIHGEENLKRIVDENALKVGVLFDKIDKKDLFGYVSRNGALPRKTFSMGEGVEKRYYLEGRMIKSGKSL